MLVNFDAHEDETIDDVERYVAFCCAAIREYGFVSRKESLETHSVSTAERALESYKNGNRSFEPKPEDFQLAKQALAWSRTLDPQNQESDFYFKLSRVGRFKFLRENNSGIAASLPKAYLDSQGRGRPNKRSHSGTIEIPDEIYVGDPGTKLNLSDMEFVEYKEATNAHVHKFHDSKGNIFVWFYRDKADLVVGHFYNLSATLKGYNFFREEPYVVIDNVHIE